MSAAFSMTPHAERSTVQAASLCSLPTLVDIDVPDVLDSLPNGVIVLDNLGFVSFTNRAAETLLGAAILGERWRDLIDRLFRPRADDGHEISLSNGKRVSLSISTLPSRRGQLISLTDMTETRELQAKISHMQRLSSLGKMVATLAHQVRTPLSAAMLYAANLQTKNLQPELQHRFSERLLQRLKDLQRQVNDMLLFAKSDDHPVVDLLSVTDLISHVEQQTEAVRARHQVQLLVQSHADNVSLLANQTALTGAIANLINNAAEHCVSVGTIQLTIEQDGSRSPAHLLIRVRDDGPGIPDQLIEQIFTPFVSSKSQGTGLGLAVVESVAKLHKGNVVAHNHPQGGAEFVLSLPIIKPNSCAN